ncbi:MAG: tRNA pseudouridine(38-40) synthase TruA, partial [Burkholderia ambifaria]
ALARFAGLPEGELLRTQCAGRTDAGVHALNQVVHIETGLQREPFSWVRGTNRVLPDDIAIHWARVMPETFHARFGAIGRRYVYVLRESAMRPALETGLVGWSFRPLDGQRMRDAAALLIGEHDFSAFRSAECQAASPVKTLRSITIKRRGAYWRVEFDANAFLHHMVRNIMGCLVTIGAGVRDGAWLAEVLAARDRTHAAPTFAPDGLYFVGPYYDAAFDVPDAPAELDWLPG